MNNATLAELSAAWLACKRAEDEAKAHRYEVEAQIAALMPGGDESTTAAKLDFVKVTVTRKLTRSVDTPALQEHWSFLPPQAQAAFTWKADVSLSALRKLDADAAAQVARFVTTKPAKAGVKVEPITE